MLRTVPSPLLRRLASSALARQSSTSAGNPESQHNSQSIPRPKTRIEIVEATKNPSLEAISIPKSTFNPKSSRSPNSSSSGLSSLPGTTPGAKSRFAGLGARLLAKRQSSEDYSNSDQEAVQVLSTPSHAVRTSSRIIPLDSTFRPQWQRPVQAARVDQESLTPTSKEGRSRGGNGPAFASPNSDSRDGARGPAGGRINSRFGPGVRAGGPGGPGGARAGGPGGPRKPANRKPKRATGSGGGMATSSATPLVVPKRYNPFKTLQLADLIKKELGDGKLHLVESSSKQSTSAQPQRLAKRQELQGDYSRFFFHTATATPLDPTSKVAQLANLRRVLNGNTSVGLAQTDFIVGKVQEAFGGAK